MQKIIAIYPGTFDPPTFGHIDVIKRAAKIYNKVILAVTNGTGKETWFDIKEREEMLKDSVRKLRNVEVDNFDGLLVNYARKKKASVIVRGLRALSDFEYEFQMALTNRNIDSKIETVFLMTHENYSYISSSLVKEIALLKGDLSRFVPKNIAIAIKGKIKNENKA